MALPKFSFNVISQEEYDARRKEEAVAATTAALPAQPPRRFTVAYGVPGVVPKIKKKSDSLFSTLPIVPNAQPAAQVTISVFAMLRVPATILYLSLMLLFLQASISGMSSSSWSSSQLSDFSATSASDFNIGRVMHNLECVRAWQNATQSRIDDAMEWTAHIRCPKVGWIASNASNQFSIRDSYGRMLNNNKHTNCERISEFIEDILSILPRWIQR